MGNRSTRRHHGQPDRAYLGESSGSDTLAVDTGSSSNGSGGSGSEQDCVDIHLIQVDATVQSKIKLNDKAWLKNYNVHVQPGRLGDIPHSERAIVNIHNFGSGNVVNVDVPTVRFCGEKLKND
jgi:hypothetical protein